MKSHFQPSLGEKKFIYLDAYIKINKKNNFKNRVASQNGKQKSLLSSWSEFPRSQFTTHFFIQAIKQNYRS